LIARPWSSGRHATQFTTEVTLRVYFNA